MKSFLAAIRFLTILPVPGTWGTDERSLASSVPFFPIVGLLLGGLAAAVAFGLQFIAAPPMVTAALLVIVLLAFSGGLHMDGLSDTADGFLSSRPRERILEIMKDSHVGAMGVIAIVCVLTLKFAALASVATKANLWAVALLTPLAGRAAIVVQMALLPYARPTGLGLVFSQGRRSLSANWSIAILAVAGFVTLHWAGLVIAGATVLAAMLFAAWSYRKIGGATGDTFGAACELGELVPALAVALWPALIQLHV
ncbi:MAG: adenosylcobinamide-GDP ribazoletransferase [Phycisphaerae bacterium]|nr:adenosylcobinamide-GDP ribazoletransferase [Phycisphaerae bacterium]